MELYQLEKKGDLLDCFMLYADGVLIVQYM